MSAGIDWLFRDPDTGRRAIVQTPNLPLVVFLGASLVRRLAEPKGAAAFAAGGLAGVALVWWSTDEILRGDSPFRRALGAVVLVTFVIDRLA